MVGRSCCAVDIFCILVDFSLFVYTGFMNGPFDFSQDLIVAQDPTSSPLHLAQLVERYCPSVMSSAALSMRVALCSNPNMPIEALLSMASYISVGPALQAIAENPIWNLLSLESPYFIVSYLDHGSPCPPADRTRRGCLRLLYFANLGFRKWVGRPIRVPVGTGKFVYSYPSGIYEYGNHREPCYGNFYRDLDSVFDDMSFGVFWVISRDDLKMRVQEYVNKETREHRA